MVTDDERREVAAGLRELHPKDRSWWGIHGFDWGWFAGELFDAIGYDKSGCDEWTDRLADLIEPSIPEDPGEAGLESVNGFIREMRHSTKEEQNEYGTMLKKMSVELHPVDRDALLALADEMDEVAQRRRSMGYEGFAIGDEDRASRIREALGVES